MCKWQIITKVFFPFERNYLSYSIVSGNPR